MIFPANLLTSTEKTKPKPEEKTRKGHKLMDTLSVY